MSDLPTTEQFTEVNQLIDIDAPGRPLLPNPTHTRPSVQLQQILDEHKQSIPDDLYLQLCNANMARHNNQDEQVWVDVTVVYTTLHQSEDERFMLPDIHTTAIRTSPVIFEMDMPLHMDLVKKHWSKGKCTCCPVHPYHGGNLYQLLRQKFSLNCEDCEYDNHATVDQPIVTIIAVDRVE